VTIAGGMKRPTCEKDERITSLFEQAKGLAAEIGYALEDLKTGGGSTGTSPRRLRRRSTGSAATLTTSKSAYRPSHRDRSTACSKCCSEPHSGRPRLILTQRLRARRAAGGLRGETIWDRLAPALCDRGIDP